MHKTAAIVLRMSAEDKRLLTGAATRMGLPVAAWARLVMREAAKRQADRQGLDVPGQENADGMLSQLWPSRT
jgi:hypothetical protein